MEEYEALGHMHRIPDGEDVGAATYYLAHHGVTKQGSLTTKLRVVFDGSAKTTSGYSLNDLQMVGPVIQHDLFSILIRFRSHKYVVSADIEKMYRQVEVAPHQRNLQRILWREQSSDKINTYALSTVTYGTAAASFLAIRPLQQLGHESAHDAPEGSSVILKDFYVDDLLTGGNSIEELSRVRDQLINILERGCFKLRKWASNDPRLLHGMPDSVSASNRLLDLSSSDTAKTLGLIWVPTKDQICYSTNQTEAPTFVTKRTILSATAKNFDPLGLLAPCIILPKVLLQKLWL